MKPEEMYQRLTKEAEAASAEFRPGPARVPSQMPNPYTSGQVDQEAEFRPGPARVPSQPNPYTSGQVDQEDAFRPGPVRVPSQMPNPYTKESAASDAPSVTPSATSGVAVANTYPTLIGAGLGGLVGGFRDLDEDESRPEAVLRSALTGGATGLGGTVGAHLGGLPGVLMMNQELQEGRPLSPVSVGTTGAGSLAGGGTGALLAYLLARRNSD